MHIHNIHIHDAKISRHINKISNNRPLLCNENKNGIMVNPVTVTDHSQITVTLVCADNPPSGFLTENLAFIWFGRLNSRLIRPCTVITTLQTSSIPPRKDRYPSLLLLLSLIFHLYLSRQFHFFNYPSWPLSSTF